MAKRGWKPGETIKYTATFNKLDDIVAGFNGGGFSRRELKEKSGIANNSLSMFLTLRVRRGLFKRIYRGLYTQVRKNQRKRLPQSFVAEKVFEVLRNANKPMNLKTIVVKTERKTGNPNLNLYHSVAVILSTWNKSGVLQRSGKIRFYRYQLMNGIHERPVLRKR